MGIRVMLVDDHCLFREGTAQLLSAEPAMEVVGLADTATQAMALFKEIHPDVMIVDINLPDQNGFYLVRELSTQTPVPKFLILSGYDDAKYVRTAFQIGASGFLCKTCSHQELVQAIVNVYAGQMVFSNHLLSGNNRTAFFSTPVQATKRELEVLALVSRGLSNKQIADHMYVSERTVHYHVGNILSKLNAGSRMEAVIKAKEAGWLSD